MQDTPHLQTFCVARFKVCRVMGPCTCIVRLFNDCDSYSSLTQLQFNRGLWTVPNSKAGLVDRTNAGRHGLVNTHASFFSVSFYKSVILCHLPVYPRMAIECPLQGNVTQNSAVTTPNYPCMWFQRRKCFAHSMMNCPYARRSVCCFKLL